MVDSDPPEYIGRDNSLRADPVPSKRKAAPLPSPQGAGPLPVAKPATYIDKMGTPTASHPKHSIVGVAKAYEAAQAETRAAHEEKRLADLALTDAEHDENNALMVWNAMQPKADPDALLRDYAARSTEQRAANVARGDPADGVRPVTHSNSPIDRAAANRQRPSPQMATTPLRSPVARRVV